MDNPDKWLKTFLAALEAAEAKREARREADRREAAAQRTADRKALAERAAEFDRQIKKIEKIQEETNRTIGGERNRKGKLLELEISGRLDADKRLGVIPLVNVERNSRRKNREFDIVCENHDSVFVGEIKYNFRRRDVVAFVEEKLPHFAELFPDLVKGKAVLGFVGGNLTEQAAAEAKKRGLIILRLKNRELVVENDKNPIPIAPATVAPAQ